MHECTPRYAYKRIRYSECNCTKIMHALLLRTLSIVNPDWLKHARSVRGDYEFVLNDSAAGNVHRPGLLGGKSRVQSPSLPRIVSSQIDLPCCDLCYSYLSLWWYCYGCGSHCLLLPSNYLHSLCHNSHIAL